MAIETQSTTTGLCLSGAGHKLSFGGVAGTIFASGAAQSGLLTLVTWSIAPGVLMAPPHVHTREDAWWVVLAGDLTVRVADATLLASAGSVILGPRAVPHALANFGPSPVRLLEIILPGGLEHYYTQQAAVLAGTPPLPAEAFYTFDDFFESAAGRLPAVARITSLWPRYGLQRPRPPRGL